MPALDESDKAGKDILSLLKRITNSVAKWSESEADPPLPAKRIVPFFLDKKILQKQDFQIPSKIYRYQQPSGLKLNLELILRGYYFSNSPRFCSFFRE